MPVQTTIEIALAEAIARSAASAPPQLASALQYATFPGGGRVRPRLCMAVASACGDDAPELSTAVAVAIELLHCASLVHDDLPCFDDAEERRGKPSLHRAYGAPLAVLVGDALIVLSFETLARAASAAPHRLAPLVTLLAQSAGAPHGLVAGQAWESEPNPPFDRYQQAKTGALFTAATMAGAIAAGRPPEPWRAVGEALGQAYQVADDLLDALAGASESGKSMMRDAALGRPNAVTALGVDGAVERLRSLSAAAISALPECPGAESLRILVRELAERLVPAALKQSAA